MSGLPFAAEHFVAALEADDELLKQLVGEYIDIVRPLRDLRDRLEAHLDNRAEYLADRNTGSVRLLVRQLNDALTELEI